MITGIDTEQIWYLYRIWDGTGRLLYIGQTGRTAAVRWFEHVKKQPWADEIATIERQAETYDSLDAVRATETAAILAERPLYNLQHNTRNPRRVAVDRHRVPVQRAGRSFEGRPRQPLRPRRRRRSRVRNARLAGVALVWLVATGGVWWDLAASLPTAAALKMAAAMVTAVMAAAAVMWRRSRRQRRRR